VFSSHPAKPVIRKKRLRQSWNTFLRPVCRWRSARWARRKLASVPTAVRIAFVVATILIVVSLANAVYQVVRKPTELLFFVGGVPRQGAERNLAAVRTALPEVFYRHHHARAARCAVANREHGESGGAHVLALAADLEPFRGVQARLKRRWPISDDRRGLRRGEPLLRPPARCSGRRLLVQQRRGGSRLRTR
jgi:hypothetical protein